MTIPFVLLASPYCNSYIDVLEPGWSTTMFLVYTCLWCTLEL